MTVTLGRLSSFVLATCTSLEMENLVKRFGVIWGFAFGSVDSFSLICLQLYVEFNEWFDSNINSQQLT